MEKLTFFFIITNIFTTQKILMMENKHPNMMENKHSNMMENKQRNIGQHKILYQKIKKFEFRNTLNHFFFVKFIPWIYDVEHYKHFFDITIILSLRKKEKKFKICCFLSSLQIFQLHIKSNKEKLAKIVKAYSNRASQRKHLQTRRNGIKLK